ncbi:MULTISPECIES: STT3 domain-containing protein [Halorussus]|uniref:STT3 domain-containing protein n=1 Tax=Halorussus TaxID=1070314 RepID=UPI00209DDCD6|nr:STT3 domain-containing protein [Halorussus vallis]USZ77393.1 hypothetical protein NGM07_08685 [Halorussus vallis]
MTEAREATDDLLAEKPGVEADLREVLSVDERTDGWTFDDVPLDSGTFGELVSRNIVSKDDGEYALSDPRGVRASLDGEPASEDGEKGTSVPLPSLSLPSISRETAVALGGALAFVALMRAYIISNVFRGKYVVLSSNDPYYYRYWVDQLAVEASGVFDLSVLSGLPGEVAKGEPLMVATLWWLTNLFGAEASGWVLAWYPVVAGVIVGVLVYALAVRVTDDRRIGVASVLMLATVPGFAYRTGLGFADHHAFDYPWLALTALSLVWLSNVSEDELREPKTWLASGVLGIAVAGQVMSWEAGPLLIGALGFYVAVRVLADVRAGRSPVVASAPIAAGLAVATVFTHLAHTGFGWHTDVVTYSPALLLVGVLGVSVLAEAIYRAEMPAFVLGAAEVAGVLGGLVVLQTLLPTYGDRLNQQFGVLLGNGGGAAEAQSLMGGTLGFLLGPPLELGLAWFVGLPILVWGLVYGYQRRDEGWLVVTTYATWFLTLALFQRRFSGELSSFLAVLAGVGFVWFAAKLDIVALPAFVRKKSSRPGEEETRVSLPSFDTLDRETVAPLVVLFLLVSSVGAVQTSVKHEQVKINGDQFQAAAWMADYSDENGMEYPQNFVLSKWGRNRMYNYFVNGEARSYRYAQHSYREFLASQNPEKQYQKHRNRVGFVVTKDLNLVREAPKKSMYVRLHRNFGMRTATDEGLSHYRAMFASDDGSVKVFALVPGANVTGEASPNETVRLSKQVNVDGTSFTYTKSTQTKADGSFLITVPYPGTYSIGDRSVTVPESAVQNGGNVSVSA